MSGFKGRYEDLQRVIEGMYVRHIAVYDLEACQPDELLEDVLVRMNKYDIDVIPVDTGDRKFDSYLLRNDIKEVRNGAHVKGIKARPLAVSDLVAAATPMRDLVSLYQSRQQPWLFVLEGNRVEAIVTQGDLQKPAFRAYIFGLLSVLEVYLLEVIEEAYPDDEWRELRSLPPEVWEKAVEAFEARRKYEETPSNYAEVLVLKDKLHVLRHSPAWFAPLGIKQIELDLTRYTPKDWLQELYQLRNNIAHSDDLVKDIPGRWRRIYMLTERLERLVVR